MPMISSSRKGAPGADFLVEAGQGRPALEKTRTMLLRRYAEIVFEMDQRSLNEARAREQKMWLAAGAGLAIVLLALMAWVSSLVFLATSQAKLPRIIHSLSATLAGNGTDWSASADDVHTEVFELVASRGSLQVSLEDAEEGGSTRRPCQKNCSGRTHLPRGSGVEPASDDAGDDVLASSRPGLMRDYRKNKNRGDSGPPSSKEGRNSADVGRDPDHRAAPTDPEPTLLDDWQGAPKTPMMQAVEERTLVNTSRICGETCNEKSVITKTDRF